MGIFSSCICIRDKSQASSKDERASCMVFESAFAFKRRFFVSVSVFFRKESAVFAVSSAGDEMSTLCPKSALKERRVFPRVLERSGKRSNAFAERVKSFICCAFLSVSLYLKSERRSAISLSKEALCKRFSAESSKSKKFCSLSSLKRRSMLLERAASFSLASATSAFVLSKNFSHCTSSAPIMPSPKLGFCGKPKIKCAR